jgi:hypothetical protein
MVPFTKGGRWLIIRARYESIPYILFPLFFKRPGSAGPPPFKERVPLEHVPGTTIPIRPVARYLVVKVE